MAEGVKNPNVILTIGFLNNKIEENLEKYKVGFIIFSNQTIHWILCKYILVCLHILLLFFIFI